MADAETLRLGNPDYRDYLCVDEFMKTLVDARALGCAFELGLIDRLLAVDSAKLDEIAAESIPDGLGARFLFDLLAANGVVEQSGSTVRLAPRFANALRYRDLLEAKLDFSRLVTADFADRFTALVADPAAFMREARLFDLFAYDRCFERTRENHERTRRWVRMTTALTRYEARACIAHHDFGAHRRMLDIGGNSGEFALQVCRRNPAIRAEVVDLPVVCDIGREHVLHEPEADRIAFHAADARTDELPDGFDLVSFKSMLHDWPEEQAVRFVERAGRCLAAGGTLLIFERGPIEIGGAAPPYSTLPMLLFFRSFRSPRVYERILQDAGFRDVAVREVPLEVPFYLVTAVKDGSG